MKIGKGESLIDQAELLHDRDGATATFHLSETFQRVHPHNAEAVLGGAGVQNKTALHETFPAKGGRKAGALVAKKVGEESVRDDPLRGVKLEDLVVGPGPSRVRN